MHRGMRMLAATVLTVVLAYCGYGLVRPTTHTHVAGSLGVPVLVLARNGPSAVMVNAIIENEGGLPKRLMHLTSYRRPDGIPTIGLADRIAGNPVQVFLVEDFEMVRTTVNGGDLWALARRGEMAFTVDMDFRVRYADGDTAVLRWSAWGSGLALGPLVGAKRDGPAGELYIIERSWGY